MNQERDWFVKNYQSKTVTGNDSVSLRALVDAVERSEALFQQYPVNVRNIKSIAQSIFVEDLWLKKPPTLAELEGKFYMVGGRHRAYAVVGSIALACHASLKDAHQAEDLFKAMLKCDINVDVVEVPDVETVVELIKADNESRTMRGAELAHVKAQTLGVNATSTEGLLAVAVGNEKLTPREQVALAAQVLTRRSHPRLKRQTLQVIGERLASQFLFGQPTPGRVKKNANLVRPREEAERLMLESYDVLCCVVKDIDTVARNANEVADKVLHLLEVQSEMTNTTTT